MLVQIIPYPLFTYGLQICDIMSQWIMNMDTFNQENGICKHWKLKSSTCDLKITYHEKYCHENLKIYISGFYIMKWVAMRLYLCKWCYSLFWLVGYTFYDNIYLWRNVLCLFCSVLMRSTQPWCFRLCCCSLWKALKEKGCISLVSWCLDL
jgi:hypothetical protein